MTYLVLASFDSWAHIRKLTGDAMDSVSTFDNKPLSGASLFGASTRRARRVVIWVSQLQSEIPSGARLGLVFAIFEVESVQSRAHPENLFF